jgi:hypothetical protein
MHRPRQPQHDLLGHFLNRSSQIHLALTELRLCLARESPEHVVKLAARHRQAGAVNEAPRSKLRGITELTQSELPEILLRLPLPLHIPFDSLPVGPFPYCGHIVPVRPKLPTPQYPLHRRLSAKNLPCREALEDLHNPAWSHFRMRTAKQMDVILVRPHRFISIGNRSAISAAVSWIIVGTTSSNSAFRYFTGKTIW